MKYFLALLLILSVVWAFVPLGGECQSDADCVTTYRGPAVCIGRRQCVNGCRIVKTCQEAPCSSPGKLCYADSWCCSNNCVNHRCSAEQK